MADRVPGGEDRLDAGQELLAVLDEVDAVADRREVLARRVEEDLERLRHLGLVGPEIVVGLGDVVLRVREVARAVLGGAAAAMVDMGVRHHHRIDVLRIDAGLLERAHELAGRRAEDLQAAHAGVEEDEPVVSTSTFCSRTALSIGRKFSLSWRSISSLLSPVKLVCGSPSGSVPSDTIVASALPSLKR